MTKSIFLSFLFHIVIIILTAISLPHMLRKPIDLPPIISVELIQISDITNIPYAPKAKKVLEKIKKEKEKERIVSEQAPPKVVKKEKIRINQNKPKSSHSLKTNSLTSSASWVRWKKAQSLAVR